MSDLKLPADIVLLHFGGPEKSEQVEPFLRNLFHDPFIIRAPLGQWGRRKLGSWIASRRWRHADEQYRAIGYSPINRYTDIQASHLQSLVGDFLPGSRVHVVNRYTAPFATDVVGKLKQRHGRRMFLMTLYPHFSHSTAGSSIRDFDQGWEAVNGEKTAVSTRVFSWWWHRDWLNYSWAALKDGLERAKASGGPVTVLFSAHGLPQKYADRGDPYPHDIRGHFADMVRRGEQWAKVHDPHGKWNWKLSYQSRVGPVEWLRPYTEDAIKESAAGGGTLLLVPISFVSDHIETLFEMDITYKSLAKESGFKDCLRVAMPNEDRKFGEVLFEILKTWGL